MSASTKPKKKKPTKAPEQQLGDTPVPPWEMPTPEEKKQAKPVKRALEQALSEVDTQEKADKVIEHLVVKEGTETPADVEQTQTTTTPAEAAQHVEQAAQAAPPTKKAEKVLDETARAASSGDKRKREIVAQAAQEVLNPEQQGAVATVTNERQRDYLRKAVLKRLSPLDALDANIFLQVNHLPHTRPLNVLFYWLTLVFTGGGVWYLSLLYSFFRKRHSFSTLAREAAVPLFIATTIVEHPIKAYFKRRRPFITIIQAVVIGKKPGSWSFPSGHSASAFGGAWLLNQKFPGWKGLTYTLAGLVAFSRIYLGDHYPGDVLSGSLLGLLFARVFRWILRRRKRT
jgi:membrane-associated phospholipid phosphatase